MTLTLAAALLLSAVPVPAAAENLADYGINEEEWEVLKLTNGLRAAVGVSPLSITASMQSGAATRAAELAVLCSHTRPDGTGCQTAFSEITWDLMGENVAWGYPSPAEAVAGWTSSPGHYQNMVDSRFTHIGIGVNGTYWTQDFIGTCQPEPGMIQLGRVVLTPDQTPEDLSAIIPLTCAEHGTSVLPLTDSICTDCTCNEEQSQATIQFICAGGVYSITVPYLPFTDVAAHWGSKYIYTAYQNKLMNGVSSTAFDPNGKTSRAMVVTVLYRLTQHEETYNTSAFPDVPVGQWYSEPVAWAVAQGITVGMGNGSFGTDRPVTRQDLAVFLWRFAGSPASSGALDGFTDAGNISGYAHTAIAWCVEHGILSGDDNHHLNPTGVATRAESAKMLSVFLAVLTA